MLQVWHNVSRVPGMGYVDGEPKTKAGRRKILLSSVVVEAFKEQNAAATANAAPLN